MTTKQINEAAKQHAKTTLSEPAFKTNKDAVKAISDDFKAGVKWLQNQNRKGQ